MTLLTISVVRICVKSLTCESVKVDLSAGMSLSNSLVQPCRVDLKKRKCVRDLQITSFSLKWPPENMKGKAPFKGRSTAQGLVRSDFEYL